MGKLINFENKTFQSLPLVEESECQEMKKYQLARQLRTFKKFGLNKSSYSSLCLFDQEDPEMRNKNKKQKRHICHM